MQDDQGFQNYTIGEREIRVTRLLTPEQAAMIAEDPEGFEALLRANMADALETHAEVEAERFVRRLFGD